ncbi:MAG TPA: serine/threonine-protein kinase [Ktedonobacteraceae bacterium]|nr:serine/threonine-protein kinase [Ktedonobacteraceae bacterium]
MPTTRGQHLLGKEIGDCLLEKLIGYGGSSAVFLAQPRNSARKVAVKVFLPRSTMDAQAQKGFYRRFLREARAASELNHPHILSVYSYGEHQGLPYIIMPYLAGGTLSDYVRREGPLSLRVAQSYLRQIAEALDYAHQCGCVHCDVKPANILLDDNGQVVLSDFGIVRLMEGTSLTAQQSMKSPEILMGTPDYISPEQALGEPLDGRSDIYSLAVTLFFLLAGEPPFKSDSSIAMALMHVHEKPPLLGLQRADVTPRIDEVIGVALAKWPEERYQTACAFSDAFSQAVSHAGNIDRVAFVNRAPNKKSMGKARENGHIPLLEPEVRVKPVSSTRLTLRSRATLLLLVLSIVVIAAITTGFVLNASIHAGPKVPATPVVSNDALAGNQGAWLSSSTFFFDQAGRYHIVNKSTQTLAIALDQSNQFTNFRLTVTANQISSPRDDGDFYGVVLRSALDQSHYYLFEICPFNGQYAFSRFDGSYHNIQNGVAPSLNTAPGQSNTISATITGNSFTFSVNNTRVHAALTDPLSAPFKTGEIGLSVEENNVEIAFSHMIITPLS